MAALGWLLNLGFAGSGAGPAVVVTSAERILLVEQDDRELSVVADDRSLAVVADDRFVGINSE